ncbi:MAG: 3-dehydroquinate synthase [Candidatus Gracilibacteria bacterium]
MNNIFIQNNSAQAISKFLSKNRIGNKYAVITDSITAKLFGKKFLKAIPNSHLFTFPAGEKSKNITTIVTLAEAIIAKQFDRKDAIIALGGGVVGDMAGFLASIYMRGIPYIQVPTTLLAMVDSSLGGKTGVDLPSGKNLLGTFAPAKAVFIDPLFLHTLPKNQIRNGLAEIIKYGVIKDKSLFNFIEQNLEKIFSLDTTSINHIISRSVAIKIAIVKKDEHESGLRMLLNYGHTFGHALERLSGYKLLHGYAIAIGMILANKIAVQKKLLKKSDAERIKNLLMRAGLPVTTMKKLTMKDLLSDKKKSDKVLSLVLPTKIGHAIIHPEKCQ